MENDFKSINKVVNAVIEERKLKEYWTYEEPIVEIWCWFDPRDAFEDMYENSAIRVIAMSLISKSQSITITHPKLISAFDNKMLIVTFPKKSFSKIPEVREGQLAWLNISTTLKNSIYNRPFYPRYIDVSEDEELDETILRRQVHSNLKIERTFDRTKII